MKARTSPKIKTQYIIDKNGKKTAVILDIKVFENLLDELEDLYDITEAERIIRKGGKKYTLEEIEKSFSLKK